MEGLPDNRATVPGGRGSAPFLAAGLLCCVALGLSLFVLRTYQRVYHPKFGWTKLIEFGADSTRQALPRLRETAHYVDPAPEMRWGYDGQFYAQMAIDPSLRDPAFDRALDSPAYRGRRIGLPALAFCLGWGQPGRIVQAYALANLIFWFLLLAALSILSKPWKGRQLLCLAAGMLSYGVIASMERALTDLPATALVFIGAVIGSWGGYAAFAAAALTRETSLLAAFGFLDVRRPWRSAGWRRNLGLLAVAFVPFAVWVIYVSHRFNGVQGAAGQQNFALPLQAVSARLAEAIDQCRHQVPAVFYRRLRWLYLNQMTHEVLTIASIFVQALFFVLRRDPGSAFWRTGVCYLALCSVLGPALWAETSAAARVLLPMTICFYLRLAREGDGWFWPFFILGSLSIPYGVHEFWTLT